MAGQFADDFDVESALADVEGTAQSGAEPGDLHPLQCPFSQACKNRYDSP